MPRSTLALHVQGIRQHLTELKYVPMAMALGTAFTRRAAGVDETVLRRHTGEDNCTSMAKERQLHTNNPNTADFVLESHTQVSSVCRGAKSVLAAPTPQPSPEQYKPRPLSRAARQKNWQ
jgi:hypothetical protein